MTNLSHQKCQALTSAPMSAFVVHDHLAPVRGWPLHKGAISINDFICAARADALVAFVG